MTDDMHTLGKRIEELEHQAAFQDELHETLNAIVARQDAEIRELKHQFALLNERVKEYSDSMPGAAGPQDETPPHY